MREDIYQSAIAQMVGEDQELEQLPEYDPAQRHRVFVYGSIKQGFGNDWVMTDNPMITATITREAGFNMISMINFPAIIRGNERIYGELYEVDGKCLQVLDLLEGNGRFYERHLVHLVDQDEPAWMYILVDNPSADEIHHLGVARIVDEQQQPIALYWQGLDDETLEQIKAMQRARMEQMSGEENHGEG